MKILIFLLLSVSAFSQVRPTYRDVSLKVIEGQENPYRWYHGKNATQIEKDALEETLLAVALPEAIRYARTVSSCQQYTKKCQGHIDSVTAKLGPIYEDHSLKQGSWEIPEYGRHYSVERYCLLGVRDCSVSNQGSSLCANSSLMTQNLQELLDIRIENGKCVKGNNNFQVIAPTETYDSTKQRSFVVQSKNKMPSLTTEQMEALHQTHEAHKAVSDYRCGVGPNPGNVVDPAHQKLESLARNGLEQHFFMMKRFAGTVDGWSKSDECKIARAQDRAHERWMNSVMAGDWRASRAAENDHQQSHIVMVLNADGYRLLPFCEKDISYCPKFYPKDYVLGLP